MHRIERSVGIEINNIQWYQCVLHPKLQRLFDRKHKKHATVGRKCAALGQTFLPLLWSAGKFQLKCVTAQIRTRNVWRRGRRKLLCLSGPTQRKCYYCSPYQFFHSLYHSLHKKGVYQIAAQKQELFFLNLYCILCCIAKKQKICRRSCVSLELHEGKFLTKELLI